jgi:hypothetical protein
VNLDLLRRWVRDELDPTTRREVGRWMLRSPDPALPGIVHALTREHEEELADEAFRARLPGRRFVVDLWRRLLDGGRAGLEALRPPALAGGAVLGSGGSSTSLGFRAVDGDIVVDLVLGDTDQMVAVLATTDQGQEFPLYGPSPFTPGRHMDVARWTPEDHEGRVTFWLLTAEASTPPDALRDLRTAEEFFARGAVNIAAARWFDPG